LPTKGTEHSARYDFYAAEDVRLNPGDSCSISLGVACAIPDDCVLILKDKSGIASKQPAGVIDADYRGEIKALLTNHAICNRYIKVGRKIVQGIIVNYKNFPITIEKFPIEEVSELSETERGEGGFGSTGE